MGRRRWARHLFRCAEVRVCARWRMCACLRGVGWYRACAPSSDRETATVVRLRSGIRACRPCSRHARALLTSVPLASYCVPATCAVALPAGVARSLTVTLLLLLHCQSHGSVRQARVLG